MSTTARSALESVCQRAKFLLDEYADERLTEFETELVKIDERLAMIVGKLSGDYVEKGRRLSLGGMLMRIKIFGGA